MGIIIAMGCNFIDKRCRDHGNYFAMIKLKTDTKHIASTSKRRGDETALFSVFSSFFFFFLIDSICISWMTYFKQTHVLSMSWRYHISFTKKKKNYSKKQNEWKSREMARKKEWESGKTKGTSHLVVGRAYILNKP